MSQRGLVGYLTHRLWSCASSTRSLFYSSISTPLALYLSQVHIVQEGRWSCFVEKHGSGFGASIALFATSGLYTPRALDHLRDHVLIDIDDPGGI